MNRMLFALSLGLVACAASAEMIVPAEWAKKFTVSFTGYVGTETLTDFPALVRLNTSRSVKTCSHEETVTDEEGGESTVTVDDYTYYLDGTFNEGFMVIVK